MPNRLFNQHAFHWQVVAMCLCLGALTFGQPTRAQEPAPYVSGREIPEGARFVILSDFMSNMVEQKHGLPMLTGRYPLAGLVVFPNQNLAPDLKEQLNSKFMGLLPMNYAQIDPHFYQALPPTDLLRIGVKLTPTPDRRSATGLAQRPKRVDEIPWLVAHQDGESFMLPSDREAVLLASPGTIFNASGRGEATIKAGVLWVFTGCNRVAVKTRHGEVQIEPFSIVAVEQTFFGKLRVASLDGRASRLRWYQPDEGSESRITVEPGHELVVTDKLVASAGTSDFVASARLPQAAPKGLDVTTIKVAGEQAFLVNDLIKRRPPFSSMSMERRYEHMMTRYGLAASERMKLWASTERKKEITTTAPSAYSASLDQRYFVPVFKKSVPKETRWPSESEKAASRQIKTLWHKRCVAKFLANAQVSTDEYGRISLESGELIVCAEEGLRVRAGECDIYLSKGVIAFIRRNGELVCVRNMKEMWNQDINVVFAKRSMKCSVGHELIVSKSVGAITREMTEDGLQRRSTQLSEFDNGNAVISKSEFSMTSAMAASPLLRQIYRSRDNVDIKIADALIKMDACVTVVTGGKGAFRTTVQQTAQQTAPGTH